jgi:hypothetical protein
MNNEPERQVRRYEVAADTWINACRWIARTLGLLYFVFISWFVMAHALDDGLPNFWQAPRDVQLDFLALFLMTVGGVVGWKWEGVAAVMILLGTAIWLIVEQHLPWPPGLSLLIGALYAITWWCLWQPVIRQSAAPQ